MLELKCQPGACVFIGDSIQIEILQLQPNQISLGVYAPRELEVQNIPPAPAREISEERTRVRENATRALCFWVVDDDASHAQIIRKAIEETSQSSVKVIARGNDALDELRKCKDGKAALPDLVLLDLYLPDMPGYGVLERIKSDLYFRHLPVVMLSSSTCDGDVLSCMEAGANAYISKSQEYSEFRDTVARLAEFWRSVRHVA